MMAQRRQGVFAGGNAMWISLRADSRVANRRDIKRQQCIFGKLPIIKKREFHEKVVRMLSVHDGFTVRSFTELKKFRILPARNRRRLPAEHPPRSESSWTPSALRHRHQPARSKNLIRAARAGLLLGIKESPAMEHDSPRAFLRHEHVVGCCIGFGAGSGGIVSKDLFDESRSVIHIHAV